jgi:hypothetical protein
MLPDVWMICAGEVIGNWRPAGFRKVRTAGRREP